MLQVSCKDCMRHCQYVQKWSRPPTLNEDFAAAPAFHQGECGTAEWLLVVVLQPHNCDHTRQSHSKGNYHVLLGLLDRRWVSGAAVSRSCMWTDMRHEWHELKPIIRGEKNQYLHSLCMYSLSDRCLASMTLASLIISLNGSPSCTLCFLCFYRLKLIQ